MCNLSSDTNDLESSQKPSLLGNPQGPFASK